MVGWHYQLNGHEFEQTPGYMKGQESLACCSPWSCKESDMTQQLNNNKVPPGKPQINNKLIFKKQTKTPLGHIQTKDWEKEGFIICSKQGKHWESFLKQCLPKQENWGSFKLRIFAYSGESNGTPLQYSCLENLLDGGAWQAAVHGVAKSRTRLK